MYYIGTLQQVTEYNEQVTAGENYQGETTRWSDPIEGETNWAIIVHPSYESEMELVEELPEEFIREQI